LRAAGFNPALEAFQSPKHGAVTRVFIPGVKASEKPEVTRRLENAGFTGTWVPG